MGSLCKGHPVQDNEQPQGPAREQEVQVLTAKPDELSSISEHIWWEEKDWLLQAVL